MARVFRRPGDECWVWLGGSSVYMGMGATGRPEITSPRRAAWMMWNCGRKPTFVQRCDKFAECVNPAHLREAEVRKLPRGLASKRCKVTKYTIERIRARIAELVKPGPSASELARKYGVSREAIRITRDGRTNGGLVLSEKDVENIRSTCRTGYHGYLSTISREFGLSKSIVSKVISGKYDEH